MEIIEIILRAAIIGAMIVGGASPLWTGKNYNPKARKNGR